MINLLRHYANNFFRDEELEDIQEEAKKN